ncbi:unnamed protein product [Polarella glacialis]|uniref:PIPK domain-containing protein n=1 Tax=Polarella glacialis TaxID=89957 RepID=A0A813JHB2_POLGL|nr:unnamed protein product [Polarella glacialis]CAE8677355.1 unnamed protein product [Polarella glacialis]
MASVSSPTSPARKSWSKLHAAVHTANVWGRRRVHSSNKVGRLLRGLGVEAELLASCLQHGASRLSHEGRGDPGTGGDRVVTFEHEGVMCKTEEYAAGLFRDLRAAFKIDESEYHAVLGGPGVGKPTDMSLIGVAEASGKSQSWQLFSGGQRYCLKTCSHDEANLLLELLPSMLDHAKQYCDTIIPRFYGLYRICRQGREVCFFISANVFAAHFPISARFDLKGSTYNRSVSKKEQSKGLSATFKDLDFLRCGGPLRLQDQDDLRALLEAVDADCRWLARHGLLDYSLLVGLGVRPLGSLAPVSRHVVRAVQLEGGGDDSPNIMYIGLVDILTRYTMKKKLENLLMEWSCPDMSCQPPEIYSARLISFASYMLEGPSPLPSNFVLGRCLATGSSGFGHIWVAERSKHRGIRRWSALAVLVALGAVFAAWRRQLAFTLLALLAVLVALLRSRRLQQQQTSPLADKARV